MEVQEIAIVLLVIVAIGGVMIYRHLQREKKELPIKEKISQLRQAGQVLMHEQEIPLTHEERARIRSRQGWMNFAMVIVIEAILIGVACVLIFAVEVDQYLILAGFFALSGGWFYWVMRTNAKQKEAVERGNKTIIRGFITRKYEDGDETTTYYIVVDKFEVSVKKVEYKSYQLGDAVEFHLFKPYYNMVLYQTKLKGAGLNDS